MKHLPATLVIIALIAWLAAYLGEPLNDPSYWFTLDAMAKVALSWAVALTFTKETPKAIAYTLFSLACSNLLDELFFDPTVTGWNEYLFGTIALSYLLLKIGHHYGKRTS